MNLLLQHSRYLRFGTLLIPFFLVFLGVRVPDLSRPHKPKPLRRAVLDKTPSRVILQSVEKISVDPVVTSQVALPILQMEEFSPEVQQAYVSVPHLDVSPFPPRAPPVSHPLA